MERRGFAILKKDFSVSLGVHAAIFLACLFLAQKRTAETLRTDPLMVEIESLPSAKKARQIVRTKQVDSADSATDAEFLGERNQKVDRQTVSQAGSGTAGAAKRAVPKKDLARLGVAILPSPRNAEQNTLGSNAVKEYVSGIQAGEETALSTREFVFFGYFERIRGRLDLAWEPILREHLMKHYRRGRRLASEMDHRTELLVILDNQGKVSSVQVVSESGTETLDLAAIQAFNRAGPFPHPPRGLIDSDGFVRIKWEFILKT